MAKTVEGREVIRFPDRNEGNPLFPLPLDYAQLTTEGQRLARINACSLRSSPEDFVTAWDFFRRAYLLPTPVESGEPHPVPGSQFYTSWLGNSPRFHYRSVHAVAKFPLVVQGAPRGFAKSHLLDELILLSVLTRRNFPVLLALASDDMVMDRMTQFQGELQNNEHVLTDFGRVRGDSSWNYHLLILSNGSRIRGAPVESRKRGMIPRPMWICLDDPEYDPKGSTDPDKLRQDFEWFLFRVLINMADSGATRITWWGTTITKQGFLWAAVHGEDPRFRKWYRRLYQAYETNEFGDPLLDLHGSPIPLWPDWRYKGKVGLAALEEKKDDIGPDAFAAEYLNSPGLGTQATFRLDPEVGLYWVEGDASTNPLTSTATVQYRIRAKKLQEATAHREPFGELVGSMFRAILMDYAPTVTPTSDFSCLLVVGFQRPWDILWVLDLFLGRVRDEALINKLWELGQKWRPRVVGVEAISIQNRIYEMVDAMFSDRSHMGGWTPKVFPIRYPGASRMSKVSRIAGLQWRFQSNRIVMPGHLRTETPWRELFHQVENFRADTMDGNLRHDDALDTLAMTQWVSRARAGEDQPLEVPASPMDLFLSGRTTDPRTGVPLLGALDPSRFDSGQIAELYGQEVDRRERELQRLRMSIDSLRMRR